MFELGNKRKVSVHLFQGKVKIDVREYYNDRGGAGEGGGEGGGGEKPGKKGLSLNVEEWETLKGCIKGIDAAIRRFWE